MPILPSGRRIELSPDRFMAHLVQIDLQAATEIYRALQEPDDLLFLLDVIYFSTADGTPLHANFVASDWEANAQDWNESDRERFKIWLFSDESRAVRAEAIRSIKRAMDSMEFQV